MYRNFEVKILRHSFLQNDIVAIKVSFCAFAQLFFKAGSENPTCNIHNYKLIKIFFTQGSLGNR
jgi:hypothetical protein